jgi:hypothetical protein
MEIFRLLLSGGGGYRAIDALFSWLIVTSMANGCTLHLLATPEAYCRSWVAIIASLVVDKNCFGGLTALLTGKAFLAGFDCSFSLSAF